MLERIRVAGLISSYALIDDGARVRCPVTARSRLAAELIGAGVELDELHKVDSTLEEVFINLAGKKGTA